MATSTPGGGQTSLGMAPNVAGLLCYVPCCIGLIFSIVVAVAEKKNRSVRFHAFQSLLLHAASFVLGFGVNVAQIALATMDLGAVGLLLSLVGMAFLGLMIFMMIKANGGEEFELPVIGPMAKGWA